MERNDPTGKPKGKGKGKGQALSEDPTNYRKERDGIARVGGGYSTGKTSVERRTAYGRTSAPSGLTPGTVQRPEDNRQAPGRRD